ncbi:hypothetical protein LINPERPRIM_LOCUS38499 [Linum perenne]
MDFSGTGPKYVGGEESVVGFDTDYLSYRILNACAKEDLGYTIVHRMWWLPPKKTMASGLRELFGDMDILYGLMLDVKKVEDGQVVMFFEAEKEVSAGWDNEDERCGWRVYGSWNSKKESFLLKCLGANHTCPRALENKQASAKWIAKTYIEKFRISPKWDVSDMKRELQLTYGIRINDNKCYRARNEARILLEGTLEEEYKKLRPYVAALQKADPEGRFVLEVDIRAEDKVTFKRIYVGFSGLFKGFLAGCRPVIGFDGCFLKGELPGMLLSAVGKDGNNQMFPLAWAVTEGETTSSWKWFVELVTRQLRLDQGNGWTVISDQQKVSLYVVPIDFKLHCCCCQSCAWFLCGLGFRAEIYMLFTGEIIALILCVFLIIWTTSCFLCSYAGPSYL